MSVDSIKVFVELHNELFAEGVKELSSEISLAEEVLGCKLPEELKWILTTHGYSEVCGLDSLDDAVKATLRCREAMRLPRGIVILNDWNDAGVVYLDFGLISQEGDVPVFWVGTQNLYRISSDEGLDEDVDYFSSYTEWVRCRVADYLGE